MQMRGSSTSGKQCFGFCTFLDVFGAGGTLALVGGHFAFVLQATSTLNSWQLAQKHRSFPVLTFSVMDF